MVEEQLIPNVPEAVQVNKERDTRYKMKMKKDFDRHHRARELSHLPIGAQVWVPDLQQYGSVVAEANPRSYIVQTPMHPTDRAKSS